MSRLAAPDHPRWVNRLAVTAAVGSIALTVGACSSPDPVGPVDPTSGDTSTASTATPTPTPTGPTPPPLPDAARASTAKGAAKFVVHYIELMNYASATGDVGALNEASTRCEGCNYYINLYEKTYARGGFFKDVGWKSLGPLAQPVEERVIVLLDVKTPDTTFRLSSEQPVKHANGGVYKLRFEVLRSGDSWKMRRFERQQKVPL